MTVRRGAPPLLARLRVAFVAEADAERAAGAQAYMKTTMPFYGVPMPRVRAICKEVFRAEPPTTPSALRDVVLGIWRAATHREEKYAAIELVLTPRSKKLLDMDALPMLEEMITSGAWWDLVDGLATNALLPILEGSPGAMRRAMRAWSRDEDMWKRRAAILCQVKRREKTDFSLLCALIEPSIDRREFFLRKAIGWALRAHAYTDPDGVRLWVDAHRAHLSPLSVREALKHDATSSLARGAPRRSASVARRTPPRARRG